MQADVDATTFFDALNYVKARLSEIDAKLSLGLRGRLSILLKELPAYLFVSEPVGAFWTGDINELPAVAIHPGPRLNVLAAALRAPDVESKLHELPLPSARAAV